MTTYIIHESGYPIARLAEHHQKVGKCLYGYREGGRSNLINPFYGKTSRAKKWAPMEIRRELDLPDAVLVRDDVMFPGGVYLVKTED